MQYGDGSSTDSVDGDPYSHDPSLDITTGDPGFSSDGLIASPVENDPLTTSGTGSDYYQLAIKRNKFIHKLFRRY